MNNNWRKIETLVEYSGKGITPKYVNESSIMVLNQKCIRNNQIDYSLARYTDDTKNINENKFIKVGDILINSTGQGTAGRCAFVSSLPLDKKVIIDSHILVLRLNNYSLAHCLSSSLFSIEETLQTFMDGSTGQGELDKVRVMNLLTNLSENQRELEKISFIIKIIYSKLELNNKINQELEEMAKTLYNYWFVQFDFPNEEGKPYKSSGGKMVYSEELKREIPEGWEVKTFGDYASVKSGFAFKSSWWRNEGISVLKIKDIEENYTINQNDLSFVDFEKKKNALNFKSKAGDVVIAMTGATIGKFAVIPYSEETILINQRVGLYNLGEDSFKKLPFLLNSMKQKYFREMIIQTSGGAAQPNISNEQLNNLKLIFPIKALLNNYNKKLSCNYKQIAINQKENQKLSELRDFLLPMLMNGQVKVK